MKYYKKTDTKAKKIQRAIIKATILIALYIATLAIIGAKYDRYRAIQDCAVFNMDCERVGEADRLQYGLD